MTKVKVTVIRKMRIEDVYGKTLPKVSKDFKSPCQLQFKEGDAFIFEKGKPVPEGFCSWAYADMQRDIVHLLFDGNFPWMEEKGVTYATCTDGLRPVVFRLERIE
ncbi:TIGR04076 family protein [Candidatus Bathyarchaeota archaeon]|nr:TIGR04076 family protein [Candidatus Bathyarchaeota archaeon]